MAKWSERGHTAISTAVTVTFPGLSIHKTHYVKPPPVSRHFSAHSASSLPCFSGQVSHRTFQLWNTSFRRARGFGTQLMYICREQFEGKEPVRGKRTATPTYHLAQKVWLSTKDIHLGLPNAMLSPSYIGPFTIQRQINKVTCRLNLLSHDRYPLHFMSLYSSLTIIL